MSGGQNTWPSNAKAYAIPPGPEYFADAATYEQHRRQELVSAPGLLMFLIEDFPRTDRMMRAICNLNGLLPDLYTANPGTRKKSIETHAGFLGIGVLGETGSQGSLLPVAVSYRGVQNFRNTGLSRIEAGENVYWVVPHPLYKRGVGGVHVVRNLDADYRTSSKDHVPDSWGAACTISEELAAGVLNNLVQYMEPTDITSFVATWKMRHLTGRCTHAANSADIGTLVLPF